MVTSHRTFVLIVWILLISSIVIIQLYVLNDYMYVTDGYLWDLNSVIVINQVNDSLKYDFDMHENLTKTFEYKDDGNLYLYDIPYFINKSIFIVSMIRNGVTTGFDTNLLALEQISCIFNNTIFLIFESDSWDGSDRVLKLWKNYQKLSLSRDVVNYSLSNICIQYKYGFNRPKLHNFNQTYDYYYNKFKNQKDKINSIKQSFQAPNIIHKHLLFGNKILQNDFDKFKQKYNTLFIDRIEKFTIFRNMLLTQIKNLTTLYQTKYNIHFDYLMVIDLDLHDFKKRSLLNELYFLEHSKFNKHNGKFGMCVNGILKTGFMFDSFATVDMNGLWYKILAMNTHFGRKNNYSIINNGYPLERFKQVKSCFGGITVYSELDELINSECKYNLLWSKYDNYTNDIKSVYWTNDELNEMLEFEDIARLWRKESIKGKKQELYRLEEVYDNHICEHIPYHYCLRYLSNYKIYIAKYAYSLYSHSSLYQNIYLVLKMMNMTH
eukprot:250965_1